MLSLAPSFQAAASSLFARTALEAKAKVKVTLFSAAVLICCWASGQQTAEAQPALDRSPVFNNDFLGYVY